MIKKVCWNTVVKVKETNQCNTSCCSFVRSLHPPGFVHHHLLMFVAPPTWLHWCPQDGMIAQSENWFVWLSLTQITGRRGPAFGILIVRREVQLERQCHSYLHCREKKDDHYLESEHMNLPTLHIVIKMNTGMHISGVMISRPPTMVAQAPGTYSYTTRE